MVEYMTRSRTSPILWDVGTLVPGSLSVDIKQFMPRPFVIPKLTTLKSTARCGEAQVSRVGKGLKDRNTQLLWLPIHRK